MFTVNMFCSRMNAMSVRIGMVVDCTALDIEDFAPLPVASSGSSSGAAAASRNSTSGKQGTMDRRVRYFHNPAEWDDYDVEYQRLMPPSSRPSSSDDANNNDELLAAPQSLPEFYRIISDYLTKLRLGDENRNSTSTTTYIALFDSRGGLGAASYLAACYMCHQLKAPVHAALEAVKVGSPTQPYENNGNGSSSSSSSTTKKFGLCDVKLLQDLQQRFRGQKEIVMEEGAYPTWWWQDDAGGMDIAGADNEKGGDKSGTGEEEDGASSRKRKREGMLIVPPYSSSTDLDQSGSTSSKRRGQNNDVSSSSSTPYPILPPDVLEPIPKDSPKYQRAMSVLAQLTPPPPPHHSGDSMSYLPLKDEFDMSIESDASNDTGEKLLECIKTNMDGYSVTWLSTKGRRGLLLILSEAVYFIERGEEGVVVPSTTTSSSTNLTTHLSVSQVTNIKFPTAKDLNINQHRTLLDVMLVKDVEKQPNNNAKITYRFYALDVLCIEGGKVWHKPLELRCRYLNDGVLIPRKKDEVFHHQQQQTMAPPSSALTHAHNYSQESIKIRANEYFPMKKFGYVMKEVCKGVGHEAEGVRIVSVGEYYDEGACRSREYGEWDKDKTIVRRWGKNEAVLQKLLQLTKDASP
jgi:hypothetical protein